MIKSSNNNINPTLKRKEKTNPNTKKAAMTTNNALKISI